MLKFTDKILILMMKMTISQKNKKKVKMTIHLNLTHVIWIFVKIVLYLDQTF